MGVKLFIAQRAASASESDWLPHRPCVCVGVCACVTDSSRLYCSTGTGLTPICCSWPSPTPTSLLLGALKVTLYLHGQWPHGCHCGNAVHSLPLYSHPVHCDVLKVYNVQFHSKSEVLLRLVLAWTPHGGVFSYNALVRWCNVALTPMWTCKYKEALTPSSWRCNSLLRGLPLHDLAHLFLTSVTFVKFPGCVTMESVYFFSSMYCWGCFTCHRLFKQVFMFPNTVPPPIPMLETPI